MLEICWTGVEKAPPFQPFQRRKVINGHINISCPHFVDYYMHFRLPLGHKKCAFFICLRQATCFKYFFNMGYQYFVDCFLHG